MEADIAEEQSLWNRKPLTGESRGVCYEDSLMG